MRYPARFPPRWTRPDGRAVRQTISGQTMDRAPSSVTKREKLEAALAEAGAVLAYAVISATEAEDRPSDADAKLESARGHCRLLRFALDELNRLEPIPRLGKRIDPMTRCSAEVVKPGDTAGSPPTQTSEHAVRGESKSAQDDSGQSKPIRRFHIGLLAREPGSGDRLAVPLLLRQSIGLLALTLAYLFYFQMDVQLQILSLPSIFPLSEQENPLGDVARPSAAGKRLLIAWSVLGGGDLAGTSISGQRAGGTRAAHQVCHVFITGGGGAVKTAPGVRSSSISRAVPLRKERRVRRWRCQAAPLQNSPDPYVRKASRMVDGLWTSARYANGVADPSGGLLIVAGHPAAIGVSALLRPPADCGTPTPQHPLLNLV